MYSAEFAAILEYLHTLFPVSLFPAKMKQTIFLFYLLIRKEEIAQKIDTLSASCIAFFFFHTRGSF